MQFRTDNYLNNNHYFRCYCKNSSLTGILACPLLEFRTNTVWLMFSLHNQ